MSLAEILFIVLLFVTFSCSADQTLQLVNLVYRHGDRTPMHGLPSENETWPEGFGQLTKLGILQEHHLGQYIRERYKGFLNSSYVKDQIYVRSTDRDRTLMSAEAVLSGLYPPEGEQQWSSEIKWQPIPVHTQPIADDQLMSQPPCDKLNLRRLELVNNPEVFNYIRNNYEDFLIELHHNIGYNWSLVREEAPFKFLHRICDNIFVKTFLKKLYSDAGLTWSPMNETTTKLDLSQLGRMVDNIIIKNIHNKPVPAWATNETMTKAIELSQYLLYFNLNDTLTAKLQSGTLLSKIITDMKLKSEGFQMQAMKMFMYSGHDSTVLPLLAVLKVFANHTCPYSTMVMIELHKTEDKKYFVQVWLRNDTTREPYLMTIPGCQPNCSLELFINLTRPMMVHDRYRECTVYTIFGFTSFKNTVIFFTLIGSALLFFVALMTALICHKCCCKRRVIKYRVHQNTELPETLPMMTSHGSLSDDD